LTDRAVAKHGVDTPEARVAVADSIAPHLAKVPNTILRAELANKLATRLRMTDKLIREGLMRAAGVLKGEIRPERDVYVSDANLAVKELLRACLTSEDLAVEIVPQVLQSGICEGMLGEQAFRKLAELHKTGEKIDLASFGELLPPEERRLVFDSLFWSGEASTREGALGYVRALRLKKAQREREKLLSDIQSAALAQDSNRLAELQKAKLRLDKELRELGRRIV